MMQSPLSDEPALSMPTPTTGAPPDKGPAAESPVLGIVAVVLLLAGIAALFVPHGAKSSTGSTTTTPTSAGVVTTSVPPTTTTLVTPTGYQRVIDSTDRLTLALPPGWQTPASNVTLAAALQAAKAKNPSMAPVLNNAIGALSRIPVGVFAYDTATKATLYTYGADVPGVTGADQIASRDVVKQVEADGGKNVQVTTVQLPIGTAGQLAATFTINKQTIAEALDYVVVRGRLISVVVSAQGTRPPLDLLRQIEPTLGVV